MKEQDKVDNLEQRSMEEKLRLNAQHIFRLVGQEEKMSFFCEEKRSSSVCLECLSQRRSSTRKDKYSFLRIFFFRGLFWQRSFVDR